MSILVVDVGTSGVRAAVVRPDATVTDVHYREVLPSSPEPGFVEFDAAAMAAAALDVRAGRARDGRPGRRGRASPTSGHRPSCGTAPPASPSARASAGRTCARSARAWCCGSRAPPRARTSRPPRPQYLLDLADPDRTRDLCFGTVDTLDRLDAVAAGPPTSPTRPTPRVTGLRTADGRAWTRARARRAAHPRGARCPRSSTRPAPSATAVALAGAPPIAGIAGDQQASLVGQGCVRPGLAKITFGTGGMLDLCLGAERPSLRRAAATAARSRSSPGVEAATSTWGVEAVMLSAGTNVEWLRDDLGLIADAGRVPRRRVAVRPTPRAWCSCPRCSAWARRSGTTARGARCSASPAARTGPQIVRAVLEGVAQRGADLVEAAEADGGHLDPGAARRRRHVGQPHLRAGAGRRQPSGRSRCQPRARGDDPGCGASSPASPSAPGRARTTSPRPGRRARVVEPPRQLDRDRWADACRRAGAWFPELSALDF